MQLKGRFFAVAASAMGVSAASMGLAFLRQVLVAAYFGVSRGLDIYLVTYAIAGMVALTFGTVFDSVAVPHLIRVRESDGDDAWLAMATSIFRWSIVLGVCFAALTLALTPLLALIVATGFGPGERAALSHLAVYFAPWIVLNLPYFAVASFYKSRWRFKRVFAAEIVLGLVTIASLVLWHADVRALPVSYSLGYAVALLWLLPGSGLPIVALRSGPKPDMRGIFRNLGELYLTKQTDAIPNLVDRHFQSLVPAGGISAVNYASQLIIGLSSLLAMREIFIVPLSSSRGREQRFERLIIGLLLISVPIAVATSCFANEIVTILYQRGHFNAAAAELTAAVLRIYIFTLVPSVASLPLARALLISDRINFMHISYLASALVLGVFGYLFVVWQNLGAQGVAYMYVAASVPNFLVIAVLAAKSGLSLNWLRLGGYLLLAAAASALALFAAEAVKTFVDGVWFSVLTAGPAFAVVIAAIYGAILPRLRHVVG